MTMIQSSMWSVTSITYLRYNGQNFFAHQISMRYLSQRLRYYYYFRFLKSNGRHIGILHPVSIFLPICRHRHLILYQPTKFDPKRSTTARVITSCRFLRRVRIAGNAERCNSQRDSVRPSILSGIVSRWMKIRSCGFQPLIWQFL